MKTKCLIPIILFLTMIQIGWGVQCEISTDNITFSNITTTRWDGCTDDLNSITSIQNLDCSTEYTLRCKNSTTSWGYETFTTELCGEREPMAALAITIFILLIAGTLFALSAKKEIFQNKYANIIVRRALLVLGIYLMILNSAIMATIAADAGIALTREMFFYMNLFGYIGYPAMIFLMLSALLQAMSDWKSDKQKKRTGEEDGQ